MARMVVEVVRGMDMHVDVAPRKGTVKRNQTLRNYGTLCGKILQGLPPLDRLGLAPLHLQRGLLPRPRYPRVMARVVLDMMALALMVLDMVVLAMVVLGEFPRHVQQSCRP